MEFTLQEIIEATDAKILKNEGVNDLTFTKERSSRCEERVDDLKFTFSTDTRTIKKGQIYLPLKGENFNGEDFIDKALEAGASGYFTTPISSHLLSSQLVLQVENTLTAYLELARFYKRKINPKTVAITGSSGKTTTKEMAFCVANEKFKTHKSELNFNNEIGLCKTILAMPSDTEVLILEMGMRGLGEIELLSKYSEPDIAIIANVGTAHIGRLGSRENIAKAKCEVVKYLKDGGVLIAHEDELIKMQRCKDAKMQSLYFSLNQTNVIERKIGYTKFKYQNHEYELNIEGDYNVQNSLATIEMGLQLGMNEAEIATGLKKYSPIEKRWEVHEVKGYKIINDSYNANPESMKATIETVLELYNPPLLLVLGDMGELGEQEVKYHQQIGDFLAQKLLCHCEEGQSPDAAIQERSLDCFGDKSPRNDIKIVSVGKLANEITKKLNAKGLDSINFSDNLQTSRYILDNIKIGTTIVLKASRSMKLEEILQAINAG